MIKKITLLVVVAVIIVIIYGVTTTKETIDTDGGIVGKDNLITVFEPSREEYITSPLIVRGEARGYWFFEGSFPVQLTNWDGLIIAETFATAKTDWMTEDFVPFEVVIDFEKPLYGERATLILQKDNPSGLPENDDAFEMTLYFK